MFRPLSFLTDLLEIFLFDRLKIDIWFGPCRKIQRGPEGRRGFASSWRWQPLVRIGAFFQRDL